MEVRRVGTQPSAQAPETRFTGRVRVDTLYNASAPARVKAASVTFEPGARTNWHKHPLGQMLIVTAGCGWVQRDGGAVEEIRPGDTVWIESHEKHWHGATDKTSMTHISVSEVLEGEPVEWLERVELTS
ncbi:(R)-mandelonitrile lyase [Variovorax rhizosphaerae]|uniref:Cupin domain-containing protein n=1 Tax=Variovorax rhizosphaerae TaxID=1836200 RepID=A0ABU8WL37_9BURK